MVSWERFLLAAVVIAPLFADSVTLKNGDRISGQVLKSDGSTVVIKTSYAGEVKIEMSAVAALEADTPLNVVLKNGAQSHGKVSIGNGLVKVDGGAPAKTEDVAALRDDDAQKAWLREDQRQHHPRLTDFWAGSLAFGLAAASGNSETTTLNTSAGASRTAGKNKLSLNFSQVYASQSTTLPHGATASRIGGGAEFNRDLAPRLYAFATTSFDYDRFLGLDLRSVFGGGLGFHAWKSARGYLDLGGGAVYDRAKYSTGLATNSAEVLGSQEAGLKLLSKLKLQEKFQIYPNVSSAGNYRMSFDTNASLPVYKFLEWNFGVSDRYQTDPLPGRKGNDVLFTTGVRLSFDQAKR